MLQDSINNKTSIDLAHENKFNNKLALFKFINKQDEQNKNTLLHRLVIENKMNSLRLILEYIFGNYFIDTIGFDLKNVNGKTSFDLAVDSLNSEAIYLLNYFYHKSSNNKQIKIVQNDFMQEKIETYLTSIVDNNKDEQIIRNLIFEGGGIKGIGNRIIENF